MNTGDKVTFSLDPDAVWPVDGETAFLRVKQGAAGISLAGIGERAAGHLETGIAPDDINGYSEAAVYLTKAGATHFAIAGETLEAGDEFVGDEDGKVRALPSDASLSLTAEADDNVVTTGSAHGFVVNDKVIFISLTGGTGLEIQREYWVKTVPSSTTFTVSLTKGGSAVDITADATAGSVRNAAKAEGQVYAGGAAGSTITVRYY